MEEEGVNATSFQLGQTKVDVSSSSEFPNSSSNFETSDTKRSAWSTCATIVDLVNHILIVCLTAFTLYYSVTPSVFNHTTLCTVGVCISTDIQIFFKLYIEPHFYFHPPLFVDPKHLPVNPRLPLFRIIFIPSVFRRLFPAKERGTSEQKFQNNRRPGLRKPWNWAKKRTPDSRGLIVQKREKLFWLATRQKERINRGQKIERSTEQKIRG